MPFWTEVYQTTSSSVNATGRIHSQFIKKLTANTTTFAEDQDRYPYICSEQMYTAMRTLTVPCVCDGED